MKKKGFTLIELLAVLIILGIILGLAVGALTGYLNEGRNKSYHILEESMKSAATDAITSCLTGEDKNREFCKNHDLLEKQYDYEIIKLKELMNDDYIDAIKDPANTDLLCSEDSYVYITNKAGEDSKNEDLQYKVCLMCSKYKGKDCLDDLNEGNYNAYCKVSYDETGNIPYDGKWTDKNLYLTLTAEGNYKYGIASYTYSFDKVSKQVKATDDKTVVTLDMSVGNKIIKVTAKDGMGYTKETDCGVVKVDKEKIISATLTGMLKDKKKEIKSGSWAGEDVILTATPNPKEVPSGYLYQWYKDGIKLGEETTSNTYTATVDGTYYVEVTNSLHNQKVTTNEFIVKFDRTKPTITAIKNPISMGTEDYEFINNVEYTFGISGGNVKCNPKASRKTGTYEVTCNAFGDNGLTASIKFKAQHSFPATYVSKSCTGERNCVDKPNCHTVGYHWCESSGGNCDTCNGSSSLCPEVECNGTYRSCDKYTYDCSYYSCPAGTTLKGATCYY